MKNREGLWEIFEIKTPVATSLVLGRNRYRKQFTSQIASYIAQTETYEEYFSGNPENRKLVKEQLGIDVQKNVDIIIVVGRSEYVDKREVHSQLRKRTSKITILTYDDILNRLLDVYRRSYGKYEKIEGMSFNLLVRLHRGADGTRSYLWDVLNRPGQDRFSIYLQDDCLFASLHTSSGHVELTSIPNDAANFYDKWICLSCSIGRLEKLFVMTLSLDNQDFEFREKFHNVPFKLPVTQMFLGADESGTACSKIDVIAKSVTKGTMDFRQRRTLYEEYRKLAGGPYVEFDGTKFMYKTDKGMVQSVSEKRPLLRYQ